LLLSTVKYCSPCFTESVTIQPLRSIKTHTSIDGYVDYAFCDHNNSTGSQNLASNDAVEHSVIKLSYFLDDSQQIFAKAKSLLMEHPSLNNIQCLGETQAVFRE
jgi:hypothetical protein